MQQRLQDPFSHYQLFCMAVLHALQLLFETAAGVLVTGALGKPDVRVGWGKNCLPDFGGLYIITQGQGIYGDLSQTQIELGDTRF